MSAAADFERSLQERTATALAGWTTAAADCAGRRWTPWHRDQPVRPAAGPMTPELAMRWLLEQGTCAGEWYESADTAPPGTPAEILAALRDPDEEQASVVDRTLYLLVLSETEDGDLRYALRVAPISAVLDELDPPDDVRAERAARRAASVARAEEQQRRIDATGPADDTGYGEWG